MQNKIVYQKEIDYSNIHDKAIVFKVLLDEQGNEQIFPYNQLPYESEMSENKELLMKFFKRVTLKVSNSKQESNDQPIYLHNPKDKFPHYNMTKEIYNAYRDILDTMPIVIFIREPNSNIDDPEYDDYNPNMDMRLQHLIDYVKYKRLHPDEGNQ